MTTHEKTAYKKPHKGLNHEVLYPYPSYLPRHGATDFPEYKGMLGPIGDVEYISPNTFTLPKSMNLNNFLRDLSVFFQKDARIIHMGGNTFKCFGPYLFMFILNSGFYKGHTIVEFQQIDGDRTAFTKMCEYIATWLFEEPLQNPLASEFNEDERTRPEGPKPKYIPVTFSPLPLPPMEPMTIHVGVLKWRKNKDYYQKEMGKIKKNISDEFNK